MSCIDILVSLPGIFLSSPGFFSSFRSRLKLPQGISPVKAHDYMFSQYYALFLLQKLLLLEFYIFSGPMDGYAHHCDFIYHGENIKVKNI